MLNRAGSGLKLHIRDLSSLALHLGPHTTAPLASVGVSVDYQSFYTVNVSSGTNTVPLSDSSVKRSTDKTSTSVVRINVEGWQNNRINLESIVFNKVCASLLAMHTSFKLCCDMSSSKGAKILPYTPSKLAFQFIGDSLSAVSFSHAMLISTFHS